MRLIDIKRNIENNINLLVLNISQHGNQQMINGLNSLIIGLNNLKTTPPLDKLIDNLETELNIFQYHVDQIVIDVNLSNAISLKVKNLANVSKILLNTLNDLVPEKEPLEISLKLYDISNFNDFIKLLEYYEKYILRPIHQLGEIPTIGNFDIGSRWIDITFYSILGLQIFAYTVESAFNIYINKYQKSIVVNQLIESYNLSQETIKDIREKDLIKLEEEIKTEVNNIDNKLKNDPNLNYTKEISDKVIKENNLKFAIEKQLELIEKGLEIYTALDAPQEVKNSLPDFKQKKN